MFRPRPNRYPSSGTGIAAHSSFTLPAGTTLTAGTVGAAYSAVTFQATGGSSTLSLHDQRRSSPAGMSLSTAGLLTGTPTAGGVFSITVLATDADSVTGSQTYSLTIHPPTITVSPSTATLPCRRSRQPLLAELRGAPAASVPIRYVLTGTLPSGLSLSEAGILSGTPTVPGGPYTFTVTATDSSTGTGPYSGVSTTYSLTVGQDNGDGHTGQSGPDLHRFSTLRHGNHRARRVDSELHL